VKHITKYNLCYLFLILVFFGSSLAYGVYYGNATVPIIGLLAVFLLPGIIQGFFWHDFFLGSRFVRRAKWDEAVIHFEKFLEHLKNHHWLKKMIFLRWSSYTSNVEAMAWSNIGVVQINRNQKDKAEQSFLNASKADPLYPVPYFNLAVIAQLKDDETAARTLWEKSQELGYNKGEFSQIVKLAAMIENKKDNPEKQEE